jgi:hypothetical protein
MASASARAIRSEQQPELQTTTRRPSSLLSDPRDALSREQDDKTRSARPEPSFPDSALDQASSADVPRCSIRSRRSLAVVVRGRVVALLVRGRGAIPRRSARSRRQPSRDVRARPQPARARWRHVQRPPRREWQRQPPAGGRQAREPESHRRPWSHYDERVNARHPARTPARPAANYVPSARLSARRCNGLRSSDVGLRLVAFTDRAVVEVPEMNGFWIDGAFRPAPGVHLCVAVSLRGGGLIAAALRGVDLVHGVMCDRP